MHVDKRVDLAELCFLHGLPSTEAHIQHHRHTRCSCNHSRIGALSCHHLIIRRNTPCGSTAARTTDSSSPVLTPKAATPERVAPSAAPDATSAPPSRPPQRARAEGAGCTREPTRSHPRRWPGPQRPRRVEAAAERAWAGSQVYTRGTSLPSMHGQISPCCDQWGTVSHHYGMRTVMWVSYSQRMQAVEGILTLLRSLGTLKAYRESTRTSLRCE